MAYLHLHRPVIAKPLWELETTNKKKGLGFRVWD